MAYNIGVTYEPTGGTMSHRIAYYRVSTRDQSIESQRKALGGGFDKEFSDAGVSGTVLAQDRPGLAELLGYAREGDSVYVYAVDRLGRDAIDVQQTVKALLDDGVALHVHGIGQLAGEAGRIVLALMAQLAELERNKILERTEAGRKVARESIQQTGKTHKGKDSMGRPFTHKPEMIIKWRADNSASIKQTAEHFGISVATVKRAAKLVQGG